jgi:hypothetical protein
MAFDNIFGGADAAAQSLYDNAILREEERLSWGGFAS